MFSLIEEKRYLLSDKDAISLIGKTYKDIKKFTPSKNNAVASLKNFIKDSLEKETGFEVSFGEVYHANGIGNNKRWMIYLVKNSESSTESIRVAYLHIVNDMFGTEILSFSDPINQISYPDFPRLYFRN